MRLGAVELTVLQVNVRPGEAVDTASGKTLVMLGDVRRKHVRVDIDEHDVPRFRSEERRQASFGATSHAVFR